MVYRRRRSFRRRSNRRFGVRRSRFSRRRRIARAPRRNQLTVYKVKRLHPLPDITANSGTTANGHVWTFSLSDISSASKYTGLFSQYMLTYVKMTFIPTTTENTAPNSTSAMVYYAVDYDDAITPTQEHMTQKQGVRFRYCTRPWTIKLRPRVLHMIYESEATTGYSPRPRTWVSTADPTCPHYGVKLWFSTPAFTQSFRIQATYYFKFRGIGNGAST